MDKIEATLMAEGLHPLDIVWLEKRVLALEEALQWCGGSPSFAIDGEAYKGWLKICRPLLTAEGEVSGG